MHSVEPPAETALSGTVFKKHQGEYTVDVAGRSVPCDLSNALRKALIYPTSAGCKHPATDPAGCPRCRPNGAHYRVQKVAAIREQDPVAVGDVVRLVPSGARGLITEVLPRKNTLVRRAAGKNPLKQIIAANVDQVVAVMAAARPHPAWELLDRYLAAAEESNIDACVVITKTDLADLPSLEPVVEIYRGLGYPTLLTSAQTGEGVDELGTRLKDRISVFAGKSGVGKTTLLNLLQPGLGLRVGEVSQAGWKAGQGKHTTTHVEMVGLDLGGAIVDTPGMREFGLWDVTTARQRREHEDVDLAEYFRELRPYLGKCRFGLDCSHTHEPRCAVKQAVEAGAVSPRRYHNYLLISGRA